MIVKATNNTEEINDGIVLRKSSSELINIYVNEKQKSHLQIN
jgi:hypothetical protein